MAGFHHSSSPDFRQYFKIRIALIPLQAFRDYARMTVLSIRHNIHGTPTCRGCFIETGKHSPSARG